MVRPPLKWAGGKRWLIKQLEYIWHTTGKHRRYVEPFCGGMAIALGLRPERAILNDINPHAVNFYKWLKKGLFVEVDMKNDRRTFTRHRERFNELILDGGPKSKEAAELFYYLNRTGFNGLCRFNSRGEFNVPFGSYKKIQYAEDFFPYRSVFKNWLFTSGDFEEVELEGSDFVYADPPYDVEFTKYSKEDFKWHDQERLVEWLIRHKGVVVLSNQATERIVKLYKKAGFKLTFLDAPRRISCNGDRTAAHEVLAIRGI